MNKIVNMENRKFGRLTVIERKENTRHGAATWLCECDCGQEATVRGSSLRSGVTLSCGCLNHEKTAKKLIEMNTRHGMAKTSEYHIWASMIQRCTNPKDNAYKNYGGRGITVCERWRKFEAFIEDMGQKPSPNLTIERQNNDGDYEPSNCRWATRTEQNNNTRRNKSIKIVQQPGQKAYVRLPESERDGRYFPVISADDKRFQDAVQEKVLASWQDTVMVGNGGAR